MTQGRYVMEEDAKSGIQKSAYSSSRAPSSRAAQRKVDAHDLKQFNMSMREVQALIQTNKHYERDLSPDAKEPQNFEKRPLCDLQNYNASPAVKRARQDGSLDPFQTPMNRTFNRKLKMRDTFTKIFPSYSHAEPTCYIASMTHHRHYYPKRDDVGNKM